MRQRGLLVLAIVFLLSGGHCLQAAEVEPVPEKMLHRRGAADCS